MPDIITPKIFRLATTTIVDEHREFLEHIGAGDWRSDADCDHALLTELAGRACYMSFGTGLNKNVTRVRSDNNAYVGDGILKTRHGSVLEHAYETFAFCDVSRIVTHELVRHRAGAAFSQESGRFVRVDKIRYYYPEALKTDFLNRVYDEIAGESTELSEIMRTHWVAGVQEKFVSAMEAEESMVQKLEKTLCLDSIKNFGLKKKLQSAIRRVAPTGMATLLIMTANHRAWRHIVQVRTDSSAEEEIRLVQYELFNRLHDEHPTIYQDAVLRFDEDSLPAGVPVVVFDNDKV